MAAALDSVGYEGLCSSDHYNPSERARGKCIIFRMTRRFTRCSPGQVEQVAMASCDLRCVLQKALPALPQNGSAIGLSQGMLLLAIK